MVVVAVVMAGVFCRPKLTAVPLKSAHEAWHSICAAALVTIRTTSLVLVRLSNQITHEMIGLPPPLGGAAHDPSARRKLVVPPPDAGESPAAEDETNGSVTSVPVLLVRTRVAAV